MADPIVEAGITPILCVGEPLHVRRAGDQVEHVLAQLRGSLAKVPDELVRKMALLCPIKERQNAVTLRQAQQHVLERRDMALGKVE